MMRRWARSMPVSAALGVCFLFFRHGAPPDNVAATLPIASRAGTVHYFSHGEIEADLIAQCPTVESTVNYLDEMDEQPVFYATEAGQQPQASAHRIVVHDARPVQSRLSLDREGFRLVEHRTAMANFRDSDEVQQSLSPGSRAADR